MTPKEAHDVTLCPRWKIVLNAMIQSRQNELQSKAIKKDCWNSKQADGQAEKAFLEEHKEPCKFSSKYARLSGQNLGMIGHFVWLGA